MAPEILFIDMQKKYSHKADVWSLGALYVYIITGSPTFIGKETSTMSELEALVNSG